MTSDNYTIIIAFKNSHKDRKRNLDFVISQVIKSKINLILVEQIFHKESGEAIVFDTSEDLSYTHVKYLSNSKFFKKSKLYNIAANLAKTHYLWFLDADVFLPFNLIINYINEEDLIKPFDRVYNFTESQTQNFLKGEALGSPMSPIRYSDHFGKYSFIVSNKLFAESKGFDEKFEGWGWEDFDFINNKLENKQHFIVPEIIGFHLHHKVASKTNERKNYLIYAKNQNSQSFLSFCFLFLNFSAESKKIILNNFHNFDLIKPSCNFVFYFNIRDQYEVIHFFKNNFYSLLSNNKVILSFFDDIHDNDYNTFCYWSSGKFIYLTKDMSGVEFTNIFSKASSMESNNVFYNYLNSSSFIINRNFLDFHNGFDAEPSAESFSDTDEQFITDEIYDSTYGNREVCYYYNTSKNSIDLY